MVVVIIVVSETVDTSVSKLLDRLIMPDTCTLVIYLIYFWKGEGKY